jgi:hypothetical protein
MRVIETFRKGEYEYQATDAALTGKAVRSEARNRP